MTSGRLYRIQLSPNGFSEQDTNSNNKSKTIGNYFRQNWDKYVFTFVIFVEYFISVLKIFFILENFINFNF